jgi:mono/diheme cytochrome c family protein
MFKKISLVTIGIAIAFSVSACGKSTPAPSTTNAPSGNTGNTTTTQPTSTAGTGTTTVDASAVYKQNCVSCHGVDLGGAVGPNLQKVGSRLSIDQIGSVIANGRNAMPAFKDRLKVEEIDALAVWLAAKK